jgi:MraZ protein
VLLGTFEHTLDAKGRIFLPARWREELAPEVVVTAGLERCLLVMTKPRFAGRAAQLEQLSPNHKASRDYNRLFFSSASEEPVDKSGRMSVPPALRKYAGLEKDVVMIGVSDRAEIWDRASWARYREEVESDFEAIAEQLD